jgi:hypothetical protein
MRHAPCKTTHKQQPAGFAKSCHGLPPCFQTTPLFPVCCLDCCHVDVIISQSLTAPGPSRSFPISRTQPADAAAADRQSSAPCKLASACFASAACPVHGLQLPGGGASPS